MEPRGGGEVRSGISRGRTLSARCSAGTQQTSPRGGASQSLRVSVDPVLLRRLLDGPRAVRGTNPTDCVERRDARENGHARQHRACSPVPTNTRNFYPLTGACAHESCPNLLVGGSLIPWHAEIGPIDHDVWPGRRPLRIQIQSEVGGRFALLALKPARGEYPRPVGKYDGIFRMRADHTPIVPGAPDEAAVLR